MKKEVHPLVSIIVPVYNQEKYIEACLDSIMFQDYPNIEIIVVADPSPDNTLDVVDNYEKKVKKEKVTFVTSSIPEKQKVKRKTILKYPQRGRKLIVVKNETRLGHSASYNLGFKMAKGKFCTYVASDDILLPQMVSTLADVLIKDEADFVYSDMFIIDDNMRILREFRLPEYSFNHSFCEWYLCGVSKLYRRELHEKYGYFNENFIANDHECYLRFAINGVRFKHISKVLYLVRSHHNRKIDLHTKDKEKRLLQESIELVKKARKFLSTPKQGESQ